MWLIHRKDNHLNLPRTGLNLDWSEWILRFGRRAWIGWHYATGHSAHYPLSDNRSEGHLIYFVDLSTDHRMYQKQWDLAGIEMVCRRCGETGDKARMWCSGIILSRLANRESKSKVLHAC